MIKLTQTERKFVYPQDKYFVSAHASTLVMLEDGRILTACFGGTREGHDDVKIYVASQNSSGEFTDTVRICFDESLPHWNPVLHRRSDGAIILYFKIGKYIKDWFTVYCVSYDSGKSWGDMKILDTENAKACGPVKNKPLRLSNGTLIAPRSIETPSDWTVVPEISYDDGLSFEECAPIGYVMNERIKHGYESIKTNGIIQPSLWEDKKGVHMLMRSTWGRLYRSDSTNFGKTWSDAYETEIPNNNSGIDLVKICDEAVALVMNPVEGNFAARTPLTVNISEDGGNSFYRALTLEDEAGEFSYPAIISDGDFLHLTYTWNRRNIIYTKILTEKI